MSERDERSARERDSLYREPYGEGQQFADDDAYAGEKVGPSDSSDSAADLEGAGFANSDSDRTGTGERMSAEEQTDVREANDIEPDRIVGADEAGLGGGLDQAEEAQLGVTDEELAKRVDHRRL